MKILTISEVKQIALILWNEGYRCTRNGLPLSKDRPLIPSVIAARTGTEIGIATKINHLLVVWSLGKVAVGEYDAL